MVTGGSSEPVTRLGGLVSFQGITLSDCWSWQLVTHTLIGESYTDRCVKNNVCVCVCVCVCWGRVLEFEFVPVEGYLPAGWLDKVPRLEKGLFYVLRTDSELGMGSVAMGRTKVLSGGPN